MSKMERDNACGEVLVLGHSVQSLQDRQARILKESRCRLSILTPRDELPTTKAISLIGASDPWADNG